MNASTPKIVSPIIFSDVFKLRVPVGRTIGDNSCHYNVYDLVVVSLRDRDGRFGWGYGIAISEGYFARSGWWIQPMPSEKEMQAELEALVPKINQIPENWINANPPVKAQFAPLGMAIEQAIWDLSAQGQQMPLWRLLAQLTGNKALSQQANPPRVPAYASLLDYPLSDEETLALLRLYLKMGFRIIKVKIGAPDAARDLARLQLVATEAGPNVVLQADANEAWDAETCISRLQFFKEAGISLHYIEDPLPRTDLAGFVRMRGKLPCKVAAHDYFNALGQYQEFIQAGAIDYLRAGQNLRIQVLLAEFCRTRNLPIYYGNSIGEQNVHAAAALHGTAKLEYSHTGWNALFENPVVVEDGFVIPHNIPGLGLKPKAAMIAKYRRPEASVPRSFNPNF